MALTFIFWGVGLAVGLAVGLYFLRRFLKGGQFTERITAKGKVAVVTGANAGLGIETVRELNLRGAKVYMLCRSEERAAEARVRLVKMGCDATRLIFEKCDLASFASVRACVKRLQAAESRIDILVNNAGIIPPQSFVATEDGHELTWQSNHLGPFLLTQLLLPLLKAADEGRIVNVSSLLHKMSGHFDPVEIDTKENYIERSFAWYSVCALLGLCEPYNRSKLANVMHSRELTRRLRSEGNSSVSINSLHPGVCLTEIGRNLPALSNPVSRALGNALMKTERDGAQTSLFLALSPSVRAVSGCYFSDCARSPEHQDALDDLAAARLFDYSLGAVGLA